MKVTFIAHSADGFTQNNAESLHGVVKNDSRWVLRSLHFHFRYHFHVMNPIGTITFTFVRAYFRKLPSLSPKGIPKLLDLLMFKANRRFVKKQIGKRNLIKPQGLLQQLPGDQQPSSEN